MAARLIRNGREIWLDGPHYFTVLAELHTRLRPKTYFEIGTLHGETLKLAQCGSVAVDPAFRLTEDVEAAKPFCRLYEQTSDDFFDQHDLGAVLGGPVDLAFLDGMHRFDFVLRDFINTERHCRPGSTVVLHDCIPREAAMSGEADEASRSRRYRKCWTGDVWKMVPVLKRLRPDLEITCLDCAPTGLVVCTNLDPASRALSSAYDAILAEWSGLRLDAYGLATLFAEAEVQSATVWLNRTAPFRHPEPAWKRAIKRALRRP